MITCTAARWVAPPGSVIALHGFGPASRNGGKWLVSTIRRKLNDPEAEITLRKPDHSLKEPAPEQATQSFEDIPVGQGGDLRISNKDLVKVYLAMKRMDSKRYPYAWGGGHPYCGRPSKSVRPGENQVGYDCSGSTAAVLAAGGLGFERGQSVPSSGWMADNWGEPGPGDRLTMWANGVHVFLEIKVGNKWHHFGTGDWGKGWNGPGFNDRLHPHAGFTARHFPAVEEKDNTPKSRPRNGVPAPQLNRAEFRGGGF